VKKIETKIEGAYLYKVDYRDDERGYFFEGAQIESGFVQSNHSASRPRVLRGMHYQAGDSAQGKLCWVSFGEVFDVFVDLRVNSPTYGKWDGYQLDNWYKDRLWIPKGCAHGFLVTTPNIPAEFNYLVDNKYDPKSERTLLWNDKDLDIKWPITNGLIISEKDQKGLSFAECEKF